MVSKGALVQATRWLIPFIKRNHLGLGIVSLLAGSIYFMVYQIANPPCCDARDYWELAHRYLQEDDRVIDSPLRTFLYPWLLTYMLQISHITNCPAPLLLYFSQTALYIAAALFVRKVVNTISETAGAFVFLILALNIFLYPYLSLSLTDSIYTTLSLFIIGLLLRLEQSTTAPLKEVSRWFTLVALLVSLAVVLRPASVWLFLPLFVATTQLLIKRKLPLNNLLLGASLSLLPLIVQLFLNYSTHRLFSFLPRLDLGKLQVEWGIKYIKYATWLAGGGPRLSYPSTALIGTVTEPRASWYLMHPLDGILLLSVKLIGAFDFDLLLPYNYEKSGAFYASVISFSFLYFGLVGLGCNTFGRKQFLGSRFTPISILIGWAAITLSSAVELRFTLPALAFMMIVSVFYVRVLSTQSTRVKTRVVVGYGVFMALAIWISMFIRAQAGPVVGAL